MGTLRYRSNNSGGRWWLDDDDWHALEAAGWTVEWVKDSTIPMMMGEVARTGRWLGALATAASKDGDDPDALVAEWEQITGKNPEDEGCNCCGPPHDFEWTDADGNVHYFDVIVTMRQRRWWSP